MTLSNAIFLIAIQSFTSLSPLRDSVQWSFASTPSRDSEIVLTLSAKLSPGWHLYSQHIDEGGPMPTHIEFESSDQYILLGGIQEKGQPVSYYDSLYEMPITWYTNEVTFSQRVRAFDRHTRINGAIEYMICNDHACVPQRQYFTFYLDSHP